MPGARAFFDSNILLYLLSADDRKADRAEGLLAQGGTISVQVLNEFAAVASRKIGMTWGEIREALDPIRSVCEVVPVTVETHDQALELAARHGWHIYDALIISSALRAECSTLYSEDLHDGQRVGPLRIVDPFAART